MEGTLADECYGQAKNEGCKVKVVWQDHPTGKVYKCGGHMGRVHTNNLKEAAKKKKNFQKMSKQGTKRNSQKWKLPSANVYDTGLVVAAFQILSSKVLGSTTFVACSSVKIQLNMHSILESCQSTMCVISILERKMVHVTFALRKKCSCKECVEDEISCPGEPYQTRNPLTCDFHWLAHRIKCERRAEESDMVIHSEMGWGHSNPCASFTVLPQFRSKSQSLCSYECVFCLLQNKIGHNFLFSLKPSQNVKTVDSLFNYFATYFTQ